jgi:hypothetical protein
VTAAAQHAGPLLELKPQFQSFRPFKQWALSTLAVWRPGSCGLTHPVEVSQCAERRRLDFDSITMITELNPGSDRMET